MKVMSVTVPAKHPITQAEINFTTESLILRKTQN